MTRILMTRKIMRKSLLITVLSLGVSSPVLAAICTNGTQANLSECTASVLQNATIVNDSGCKGLSILSVPYTINLGAFGMCKVTPKKVSQPQTQPQPGQGTSGGTGSR